MVIASEVDVGLVVEVTCADVVFGTGSKIEDRIDENEEVRAEEMPEPEAVVGLVLVLNVEDGGEADSIVVDCEDERDEVGLALDLGVLEA